MSTLCAARADRLEAARARAAATPLDAIDVSSFDLFGRDEHWAYFERLRREAPVHHCRDSLFGPYWSVTRYHDIMTVDTDHRTFSSSHRLGGISIADQAPDFPLPMFIAMDPPEHGVMRKAVSPPLAPPRLAVLEAVIRTRVTEILDRLPRGRPFNWVEQVSVDLTSFMLATLFGLPQEDRGKLVHWSNAAVIADYLNSEDDRRAALLDCLAYFKRLRGQAATDPASPDFFSRLTHDPTMRDLDDASLLGNILLLIVGGNDTTRNSIGGAVYGFSLYPQEWRKLTADASLIPSAVAEIIRWQTPLAHMRRTAVQDAEIGAARIRRGDKVIMWYVSGNRDEAVMPDPDALIVDRAHARRHLSFGFGLHRCLGNRAAELQIRVLLEEMLRRGLTPEVVQEPARIKSCFVHGYEDMYVELR